MSQEFTEVGQLNCVLGKASKIVNHVHKLTILNEEVLRLQVANATRWNSQMKMIHPIVAAVADMLDQLVGLSITGTGYR